MQKNKINNLVKVVYIISHLEKSMTFEWVLKYIDKSKFEIHVISLNQHAATYLNQYCESLQIPYYHISYRSKKDIPKAIYRCLRLFQKIKADVVHAHLIDAGLVGLTAATILRIKKRIYTRHYATLHHEYYPNGVKYDHYINIIATGIIAISENVQNVLIQQEHVPASKVQLIYHGFDISAYDDINQDRIALVQTKYNLHNKGPVIGMVSRYFKLKGIEYALEAFSQYLEIYPNAVFVIANAFGPDENEIKKQLALLPEGSYREIYFEQDMIALYKCFDLFIHVPINNQIEAFGLIYIEAILAELPCIFTKSGIANEVILNNQNAIVVDYKNSKKILEAMYCITEDEILKKELKNAKKRGRCNKFSVYLTVRKHENLYLL